jgi:predicted nucleotidyltransferase
MDARFTSACPPTRANVDARPPPSHDDDAMNELDRLHVPADALAALCREFGVVELSVFGSVLRADFRPDSDVDLLVVFDKSLPVGLFHILRLQQRLTTLLGRPVDLVPKAGLKPLIRDQVLASARRLYAA